MASKKIYVVSQLNPKVIIEECEKIVPKDIQFELVNIRKAKPGVFQRELWLEPEDLADLKDAEIIIGDNMFMPQIATTCPKCKWIQGTYAGVDTVFKRLPQFYKPGELPSLIATRFTGPSFGKLMSDYCLGYILAVERSFIPFRDAQSTRDWSKMLAQQKGLISRSSDELTISVLGFGPIGKAMCRVFASFGSKVIAFARSDKPKKDLDAAGVTSFTTDLDVALSSADYVVAILPDTPETIGLLNNNRLQACQAKKPTLINVGRGSLVSSKDVIKALDSNWISHAVLDVFEQEPLPSNDPLWVHPKVIITPHISAISKPKDIAQVFKINYEHFKKGEPLNYVISWKLGY